MKKTVVPFERHEMALTAPKCMYSVSLSTDEHRYGRMLTGFAWAKSNFSDVLTYLGDGFLLETTLRMTGTPADLVPGQASALGARAEQDLRGIQPAARFWRASESAADPDFREHHDAVRAAYTGDLSLRDSIDSDARAYIERLTRNSRLQLPPDVATGLAIDYIVFEIAGYSLLSSRGYIVDVYASGSGELPTLEKFMLGQLHGFPQLQQRACIILGT